MSPLKMVIMAAGLGSRYGGLKQIDQFGPSGEFLMDYAIYDAYLAGIREICVVVRESFHAEIKDLMQKKWQSYKDLSFEFINQEVNDLPTEHMALSEGREKPWGTAHILYVLRGKVKSPFLIMNADDYYARKAIHDLAKFMNQNPQSLALASYRLQETLSPHGAVTRGICEIRDQQLVAIDEVSGIEPNDPRDVYVSMNLWGFSPSLLEHITESFKLFLSEQGKIPKKEYQIPQIINDLLKEETIKVHALPVKVPWFGVTYKEDKPEVKSKINAMIEKGEYPSNLFAEAPR